MLVLDAASSDLAAADMADGGRCKIIVIYPAVSHRPGSHHHCRSSIGDNNAPSLER